MNLEVTVVDFSRCAVQFFLILLFLRHVSQRVGLIVVPGCLSVCLYVCMYVCLSVIPRPTAYQD